MAQLTSAGVGIALTLAALLLSTVGMLAGEVARPRPLARVAARAGLVFTVAAILVIVLRFIYLSH